AGELPFGDPLGPGRPLRDGEQRRRRSRSHLPDTPAVAAAQNRDGIVHSPTMSRRPAEEDGRALPGSVGAGAGTDGGISARTVRERTPRTPRAADAWPRGRQNSHT